MNKIATYEVTADGDDILANRRESHPAGTEERNS